MLSNVQRIRTTRERLATGLSSLGFHVVPSQTNFVWATHPTGEHRQQYEALKMRKILVRYMKFPNVDWAVNGILDGLRITVGTDDEIDKFLAAMKEIV